MAQKEPIVGPERCLSYSIAACQLKCMDQIRYMAYSSDVGESFRPILQPASIRAAYGVAIAYVVGDTAYEVHRKDKLGVERDALIGTLLHRSIFHAAMSLVVPAALIHTAVHNSRFVFAAPAFAAWPFVVKWGPSATGLAIVPFLPLADPPAEFVLDAVFDRVWPSWRRGEQQPA